MKDLFYFLSNQGVNYDLIWNHVSVPFFLVSICFITLLYLQIQWAKEALENKCAELFAAKQINSCLNSENSELSKKLEFAETLLDTAEKELEKYNYPRDSKGHFVSKDPNYVSKKKQPKIVENV